MRINSEENITICGKLEIEDSNKQGVNIKIDAAHAGTVNGNFLFYLPKALQTGATSLKSFYKPLQKGHYSKTLGYIYDSYYESFDTKSSYYNQITEAKDPEELVDAVKSYIKSKEYKKSKGFGVLSAKAKLYDGNKIKSLKSNDVGTVSVAGDSSQAYCSICAGMVADCGHKLGQRYGTDTCIGIVADGLELDHISFEAIPANWETKSLIIQDSLITGKLEILKEGQFMKLTLVELREKLVGNLEEVLKEFNLESYLEQYKNDCSVSPNSSFLLSTDKLIPTNTPLAIFIAQKLLDELEESEDKEVLVSALGTLYTDLFEGKNEDEIKSIIEATIPVKEVEIANLAPAEGQDTGIRTTEIGEKPVKGSANESEGIALAITDSDKIVLAIKDSLNTVIDEKFSGVIEKLTEIFNKEATGKANQLLEDRIVAFKADLTAADLLRNQITEELKESLLNQILLIGNIEKDSEYFESLKSRNIQELKMTLADHISLFSKKAKEIITENPTVLPVADSQQKLDKAETTEAIEAMAEEEVQNLQIEDSDKIVTELVSKLPEGKLTKKEFTTLYKDVVFSHGTKVAKKLQPVLKEQNKI